MNKVDQETTKKIQELQALEQGLQNIALQKQAFQLELDEAENSLEEIKKTKEDVYKLVGQIMIKGDKKTIEKEIDQKKEILKIRTTTLEKQEQEIEKNLEKLKKEVLGKIK